MVSNLIIVMAIWLLFEYDSLFFRNIWYLFFYNLEFSDIWFRFLCSALH